MTADSLLQWRDEFPILSRCNYLISNSLGAMPRGVYDSLHYYADTWAEQGVSAWGTGWFELPQAVGNKIAPLMGAAPDTVLVHQNASIANSILFGSLDFSDRKRDKVVVTELDFPSDVYVLRRWLPEHMRIHMVQSPNGITIDTDELLDAIDERTRLVSVSHVLFRSAYIMPAQEIVAKAHSVARKWYSTAITALASFRSRLANGMSTFISAACSSGCVEDRAAYSCTRAPICCRVCIPR